MKKLVVSRKIVLSIFIMMVVFGVENVGYSQDPGSPAIYWTDTVADKIQRANLDGSNVEDLITGLNWPADIAVDIAGSKMYWTNSTADNESPDEIQRANLDGSNVETVVPWVWSPVALTLDVAGGKIYWIAWGTGEIQRANLDGSNIEDLVSIITGNVVRGDIALDVSDGKMYWVCGGTNKIQRANLDGSNVETVVTQGLEKLYGIALDVAGGKMYWTNQRQRGGTVVSRKIQRANLDGSNIEDLITGGLGLPADIALDVSDGKMYWASLFGSILRANLDGSNIEYLVRGLQQPDGIVLVVEPVAAPVVKEPVKEDIYRPVNAIRVEAPGTMILGGVFENAGCLGNLNFNGVDYRWHSTKWQRRETAEKPWVDIPGTQKTNQVCGFRAKLPGEYRLVGEISINGVKGKRRSANTFQIAPSQVIPPTPDLVVEAVQAEPSTVEPGAEFRLYATLRNRGTGESAATTLRYYRSTDRVISTADTQLGRANRDPLAANGTLRRYLNVTAPTTPGTYYYGVCVDSVTDESDTANNCSQAVSVTVTGPAATGPKVLVVDPDSPPIYWTDYGTHKIQRANLDGSNIEDLITGLDWPMEIELDVSAGKMYWTNWVPAKIQRANLDGSNIETIVPWGDALALDVAGGKMYWTGAGGTADKIQRANLDGSNIEELVSTIAGGVVMTDIALDVSAGKMYYARAEEIQRANLDGSSIETIVPRGLGSTSIALDVSAGKIYWVESDRSRIRRANLDGSNIEDIPPGGLNAPEDIVLDVAGGKMYWTGWTDRDTGYIRRANLDGSNIEHLITGLQQPGGIALGILSSDNPTIAEEDVNRDGVVDVNDLVIVARRYGKTGTNAADVNGDGVVNIDDLILVAAALDADAAAAPSLQSEALDSFSVADVQRWLSEARERDLTDPSVRKGILFLEQLLASMVPKETMLLANYPNPFNPETWIPYQLAKPAEVRVTIYGIDGQVVRQLALGHQPAGVYQSRSRAAYWDGRNVFGEKVASGLYFYTLTAGDFSATRKMLIRK